MHRASIGTEMKWWPLFEQHKEVGLLQTHRQHPPARRTQILSSCSQKSKTNHFFLATQSQQRSTNKAIWDHIVIYMFIPLRSLQGGSGYFYFLKPPEHLQWRKDLSLFRPDLQQNCRAASLSSRRHSAMASYAGCPVHSHPEKPSPQWVCERHIEL